MTSRWDANLAGPDRELLWQNAALTLSLDATRAVAGDLDVDEAELAAAQPEIRRLLSPAMDRRLRGEHAALEVEAKLPSMSDPARELLRRFRDHVVRYADEQPWCHQAWIWVLRACDRSDERWRSLGLPADVSPELQRASRKMRRREDFEERAEAALSGKLSPWDLRIAALRLLPTPDGTPGIDTVWLTSCGRVVFSTRFWRQAALLLGKEGLAALRARASEIAGEDEELRPFRDLYDPWLLAHPEEDTEPWVVPARTFDPEEWNPGEADTDQQGSPERGNPDKTDVDPGSPEGGNPGEETR
jgi:hypothetical protein